MKQDLLKDKIWMSFERDLTMFVGYARVSTQEQDPALQLDALHELGCERIFTQGKRMRFFPVF